MITPGEFWNHVRVLMRWWWVLALSTLLAAGVALVLTAGQPKYYVAQTTLMVGETLNSPTPDTQLIGISTALAGFYAEMAKREPILEPVTERLGLSFPWQIIATYMLKTGVNSQASLLNLQVTDTNPERAAAIVTAIGDELVRYSPNSPDKVAAQRSLLSEQLTKAQASLASVESNIEEARNQQLQATGAADLREARARLQELENSRQSAQEIYNQLMRLQSSSIVNSLSVVEPARVPTTPLPSKKWLTVALAALGGLVLAIIAAFLLERLDDRWRSVNDLNDRFGLTILGQVPGQKPLFQLGPQAAQAREPAVREAHTQLVLAGPIKTKHTIMVSSARPQQGRSALSIDLAQLFTRSGYRVLLVDADTEEPTLTELFGEPEVAPRPVVLVNGEAEIWSSLCSTPLKNVMLLAHNLGADGRPLPPSLPWPALVESLNQAADVIIFDGPSTLTGVDAALLAPLVDGVILTVDPRADSRADVVKSKARLSRRNIDRLLGAVMITDEQGFMAPKSDIARLTPAIGKLLLGARPLKQLTAGSLAGRATAEGSAIITPQYDGDQADEPSPPISGSSPILIEPTTLGDEEDESAEKAVGAPGSGSL